MELGRSSYTQLNCGALAARFRRARADLGSSEPTVFDIELDRFLAVKKLAVPAVFRPLATPALGLFTHQLWIPYSATPAEDPLVVGNHPTDVLRGYPEGLGDFHQFLRRLLQRGVPRSKAQGLGEDLDVLLECYVQESSVAGSKPALAQMGIVWIDRLVCIDRQL